MPSLRWPIARAFATSALRLGNRAIVYSSHGDPSSVLSVVSFPDLPPPPPNTLNIRFLLSPINPADINVIQGIYPAIPSTCPSSPRLLVPGNEGLAEVVQTGDNVTDLHPGDRVIMIKQQIGTWISGRNVHSCDVLKVPPELTEVQLATVAVGCLSLLSHILHGPFKVNPPTAYNMLHDFVQLRQGDWVVQNGANSAVRHSSNSRHPSIPMFLSRLARL